VTRKNKDTYLRICEQLSLSESLRKVWIEGPTTWWTSGIYSLGIGFREMLGLSRHVPLNFMSDHGVTFGKNDFLDEARRATTPPQLYLTWFEGQIEWSRSYPHSYNGRVLGCPHPFPFLRRKMGKHAGSSGGCLGFLPHGLGEALDEHALEDLILQWRELPRGLSPNTVCVSHHEASAKLFDSLRLHGLTPISMGNPNSPWFASRFYEVISRFEFLTSPVFGSQFCFATEAGSKCFLYGSWPDQTTVISDPLRTRFRERNGVEWVIDEALWMMVVDVFSDPYYGADEKQEITNYLLGQHMKESLSTIRAEVLEVGRWGGGSWVSAGRHLSKSAKMSGRIM